MEKGKKPARIDLRQDERKPRREQQRDEAEPDNPSELTLDELEPRVSPRSIGTFF